MTVYRQWNFLSRWRNKRSRGVVVPASRQQSNELTPGSRTSQRHADSAAGAPDADINVASCGVNRMSSTSSRDRLRALCKSPTIDESLLEQLFIADVKGMNLLSRSMNGGDDDMNINHHGVVTAVMDVRRRDFGVQTGGDLLESMVSGLRRRHKRQSAVDVDVSLPLSPSVVEAMQFDRTDYERRLQLPVGTIYRHSFSTATTTTSAAADSTNAGGISSFVDRRPSNRSTNVDASSRRSPIVLDVSAQLLTRQLSFEPQLGRPITHVDTFDDETNVNRTAVDSDLDDLLVSVSPEHHSVHRRLSLTSFDSPPIQSPSWRSPPEPMLPPPPLYSTLSWSGSEPDECQPKDCGDDCVRLRRSPFGRKHRATVKAYGDETGLVGDRLTEVNSSCQAASPRQSRPLVLPLSSPPFIAQRRLRRLHPGVVGGQDSFANTGSDFDPTDGQRRCNLLSSANRNATFDQMPAQLAAACERRHISAFRPCAVPDDRKTSSPSGDPSSANSINNSLGSSSSGGGGNTSSDDEACGKSMSNVSLEDAICIGMNRLSGQSSPVPLTSELYDFTLPTSSIVTTDRTNSTIPNRAYQAPGHIRFQSSDV